MSSLPPAQGVFLTVQIGNYLLTLLCLVVAWRNSRSLLGLMIGSMGLGYALEASQTTKDPAPYHYTEAIIGLPGGVPLGVVLSWGMILFAIWHVLDRLELGIVRHAFAGGMLALMLDFVTDPSFVYLGFWVWEEPTQYFGIPLSNFVGWFVIVTTFFVSLRLLFRRFPPEERPVWQVVLTSLVAIGPAFLSFVVIMLVYEGLVLKGPQWLTEPRVAALFLFPAFFWVILGVADLRRARRDHGTSLNRTSLMVPTYLLAVSLLTLFVTGMQETYAPLVIVDPILVALVLGMFRWALRHQGEAGPAPG